MLGFPSLFPRLLIEIMERQSLKQTAFFWAILMKFFLVQQVFGFNYYQVPRIAPIFLQPQSPSLAYSASSSISGSKTPSYDGKNIFNDRATILYRPQTPVVLNDGQEKDGDCPVTRPASGYSSFKQYEGLWFKRYRSRVRPGEPFFKCAYIDYIPQGNNSVFILDNLQNNQTGVWFRQNATTVVWANDPTTWTSTLASGVRFDTHLIYYDGDLGVAVIYSCSPTSSGGHRGIGNIYTRSPQTPLPKSYVDFLLDVFYQNGIYDVLPLHFVQQDNCDQENMPRPRF